MIDKQFTIQYTEGDDPNIKVVIIMAANRLEATKLFRARYGEEPKIRCIYEAFVQM